ncbi:MacS family sensor histidine kinase [Amycolatopsis sp. NPDC059657]|uniref:MacS family sensor histidine kinase n=1 Tax=Amycolatopsis sp. NPDC059657 TaxID=3346899 RepID=UPI00366F5136
MTKPPAPTGDPATPLWLGIVVLRVLMLMFAAGAVIVRHNDFARPWLAWTVLGVMVVWTVVTDLFYAAEATRWGWLTLVDLVFTGGLLMLSPMILSQAQFAANSPLITTVWAAVPPLAVSARYGAIAGALSGLFIAVLSGLATNRFDLDVARDGTLLIASGLLVGVAADTARTAAERLTRALRTEAATAERERLARSIHDSVLQVLARVRRRGAEFGGEAAELAKLAGEQEVALRALVTTEPVGPDEDGTTDLRAALQLLATPDIQISTPAGTVPLPAHTTAELVAVTREALSNVEKHAPGAKAWVLLEDLGTEVVVSVRDDGPGIEAGRLENAERQGRLGVAKSIRGRVADLGGTCALDSTPGSGTEWEVRIPVNARGER